jgi:tRNA 5-methylaminomethyl-2-thiouridine biosynthesis bifunctional protein
MDGIERSNIVIGEDGVPRSLHFDDVYYDRENGLAESRYVFVTQSGVAQALQQPGEPLVIGETGFGSGLNFLATWLAWHEAGRVRPWQFISFEKYPLKVEELRQAHALFPELKQASEAMLAAYSNSLKPGLNRWLLADGQVMLQVFVGDVKAVWPQWSDDAVRRVNYWYLDGFAPSKNPDLWSEELFGEMVLRSAPGARFATFSAAGSVRRGLESVGFEVEKFKGFGRKREMLRGRLRTAV